MTLPSLRWFSEIGRVRPRAVRAAYVLALLLLLGTVRSRSGALSWVLGVAAVISTLLVSVWPLVAVGIEGAGQVRDVIPFIQDLIARMLQR